MCHALKVAAGCACEKVGGGTRTVLLRSMIIMLGGSHSRRSWVRRS
jgi:hypothetical protein